MLAETSVKDSARRDDAFLLVLAEDHELDVGVGEAEEQVPGVRADAPVTYRPRIEAYPHVSLQHDRLRARPGFGLKPT